MERCYFKGIVETDSKEGIAFLRRFDIDTNRCLNSCSGYLGYGDCEYYITREEIAQGGLSRIPISDEYERRIIGK